MALWLSALLVGLLALGTGPAYAQTSPQYRSAYRPSESTQYTWAKYGQTAMWWRYTTQHQISIDIESIRVRGSRDNCVMTSWRVNRMRAQKLNPSTGQWEVTLGPLGPWPEEFNCGLHDAGALVTVSTSNLRSAWDHRVIVTNRITPHHGGTFSAIRRMRTYNGQVRWYNPANGAWPLLPTSATAP